MKRIILSLILSISFALLYADVIEKTYVFSSPVIADVESYKQISFEGCMLTAPAGDPAMPYMAIKLLLPPGHVATGIQIISGDAIPIDGEFIIYPMQHARPLSKGISGIFRKNETLYSKNADYPEKLSGEITTQFLNGFAIAISSFTPLRYNPVSGKVTYYKSITVRIETKPDLKADAALENLHTSLNTISQVQEFVQNTEAISSYPKNSNRSETCDLLYITPQAYLEDFQQLAGFYFPRGLIAEVTTTEEIYASMPGQDNPEKIRNYIIQEYQNHGIAHVTLGGDVEFVPYRGFYCGVQSSSWYEDNNIPSDLYYAALDGNWNDDGDNLWGEIGEDDLLPEIGIGRMSFSTQAELEILINKTIQYQENPVLGELAKPLLVGEFLYDNPETWGSDYLELLIGYHNDNGYQTTGIPETQNIEKLYASQASWDKNTLKAQMNQGGSFIHHVGHANASYTMKFSMSDITDANFTGLNGIDHNYALIYSHGCICGAFDNSDCIAEKMININNLAVAVYMNSRYGWFNEGQTEGPAAHINRELVDAFYDKKEARLGMAYTLARMATAPWVTAPGQWEEGALRWNFYDCNLLGDAAISFWPDEPMQISAAYTDTIFTGAASIQITLSGTGNTEDLCCHFVKDSISCGMALCDENGNATITFSAPLADTGVASIFVSGYDCQLTEFIVSVLANPVSHFQPVWTTPFNPMTIYVEAATIDEENMQAGDEIGIFDINPGTGQQICVGTGILSQQLSGGAYLEIAASMDDGSNPEEANGFNPGNNIIYRLWSSATGEISNVTVTYPYPGYDEVFTALGTGIASLSGSTIIQQQIQLKSGWSGISSRLIPENTNLDEMLSGISGQVEIIRDMNDFFRPDDASGNLTTWNYQSGYCIKTTENTMFLVSGTPPQNPALNLSEGWNLIPVLSDETVLIATLFSGQLEAVLVIKDAVGVDVFWPSENIITFQALFPGRAYLVKVSQNMVVSY
ncbi:MAG: hypothetical protein K9H16_00480 [Bacteroidales bacterium]|nr:hypothetical protein [Bacteroidales bacterium]